MGGQDLSPSTKGLAGEALQKALVVWAVVGETHVDVEYPVTAKICHAYCFSARRDFKPPTPKIRITCGLGLLKKVSIATFSSY